MLISLRYEPQYSRMIMELMEIRPLPLIHETKEKGVAVFIHITR